MLGGPGGRGGAPRGLGPPPPGGLQLRGTRHSGGAVRGPRSRPPAPSTTWRVHGRVRRRPACVTGFPRASLLGLSAPSLPVPSGRRVTRPGHGVVQPAPPSPSLCSVPSCPPCLLSGLYLRNCPIPVPRARHHPPPAFQQNWPLGHAVPCCPRGRHGSHQLPGVAVAPAGSAPGHRPGASPGSCPQAARPPRATSPGPPTARARRRDLSKLQGEGGCGHHRDDHGPFTGCVVSQPWRNTFYVSLAC